MYEAVRQRPLHGHYHRGVDEIAVTDKLRVIGTLNRLPVTCH